MAVSVESNVPVMLGLAILTYRGFYFWRLSDDLHGLEVREAVRKGLDDDEIRAAIGPWELVWGPATRQLGEDFDASAMYVARHCERPTQLVVAVRGTNPIAATDWVAGDFNVAAQIPWPFAASADGGHVSGSTAFGLRTLLGLTEPAGSVAARAAVETAATLADLVPEVVANLARGLPSSSRALASRVARVLRPALAEAQRLAGEARVDLRTVRLDPKNDQARENTRALVTSVAKRLAAPTPYYGSIGWPPPPPDGPGKTLIQFLTEQAGGGALEIIVTGHSKGGALAPALALWLAETRSQWAPTHRPTIGCYAFAGPTPGTAAFARRVAALLDGPRRRVTNTNDLVTHAWDTAGLTSIPRLYGGQLGWLAPVITVVNDELKSHDYAHVELPSDVFEGALLPGIGTLPDASPLQFVHQHLDAYLEHAGLAPALDAIKLVLG